MNYDEERFLNQQQANVQRAAPMPRAEKPPPVTFAELLALREQLQAIDDRASANGQDFRYELDRVFDALRMALKELAFDEAAQKVRADGKAT